MKSIKVLKNLLLVERVQEETRMGFFLPDHLKDTNFGIVIQVGPGKKMKNGTVVPIPINVGDKVMINPGAGRRDLDVDGKQLWLMDADNILAVMSHAS